MAFEDYKLLRFAREGRLLTCVIDAPPMNVMTLALYAELARATAEIEADPESLVVVFKSADPDFFIAHFDVSAILGFPVDRPAEREGAPDNAFHAMCLRLSSMDKVTIAQIAGRVGGGGSEFSMGFDMRFGARGVTRVNQMEVPLGILPGGSGTQRLPRIVGRARALEIILGGGDVDAETAERWGYLNRALAPDELDGFVGELALRIASFPPEAVKLAKRAVQAASGPLEEGLREESFLFQSLIRTDDARRNMQRFLDAGGQTRDVELRIEALSRRLNEA